MLVHDWSLKAFTQNSHQTILVLQRNGRSQAKSSHQEDQFKDSEGSNSHPSLVTLEHNHGMFGQEGLHLISSSHLMPFVTTQPFLLLPNANNLPVSGTLFSLFFKTKKPLGCTVWENGHSRVPAATIFELEGLKLN